MYDESDEVIEIVELLDARIARNVADLSDILVKKYSFIYYSKASTQIVEWYLRGNRFVRYALPSLVPPVTPTSSRSSLTSALSTPTSSGDTSSDDMPVTPTSPDHMEDPFLASHSTSSSVSISPQSDKENVPACVESVMISKNAANMDEFAAHDFQNGSHVRSALHELNVLAPSPIRHVLA